ncbi:site-specific integrase [Pseudoxanthomonas sp.]|uniref:site-specific integrase n=1 Tax=Pseudoxanthomonas sp. TaxID=1871049 RepID=UPI003F8085E7
MRLPSLRPVHVAEWRERRLKEVLPASVLRDMNLLQSVLKVCRKDWGWLDSSPMKDVDRPPNPPPRRRRISQDEIDRVTLALGYDGGAPETASERVALAFLLALETAMRTSEILGMVWADVGEKSVTLPRTKNGDVRRVPLSARAREILALMPRGGDTVFEVDPATKDVLWRRARDASQIQDLHFHDSRAEAIWRLSKKLDVMELARMIGHRDIRSLMFYYNADPDELADRL